jgi:hypothetical protein
MSKATAFNPAKYRDKLTQNAVPKLAFQPGNFRQDEPIRFTECVKFLSYLRELEAFDAVATRLKSE